MFEKNEFSDWRRKVLIGCIGLTVLGGHAALIWTLQKSKLTQPERELLVPVSQLAPPQAPPAPDETKKAPARARVSEPASVQPKLASQPVQTVVPAKPEPAEAKPLQAKPLPTSPPALVTAADGAPSAEAHSVAAGPNTVSPGNKSTSNAVVASVPAPAAPPLQWPSSNADYLRNPKPVYPVLSKRLNEQGTAVHSVLIGADGRPLSAKLVQSSGYDRLDKAAYEAVMQWRYVPGKRQGVPEAMAFNVPIQWVLE